MKNTAALAVLALTASAAANPLKARANFPIPASKGTETFTAPKKINSTFDGGMKTYGRGASCTGQVEGGDSDAVFLLADGATLSNAIIGADQIEGVHCLGSCTINNVWWASVCEDALTLKGDGDATVTGGGATGAKDKVIQHNGAGTVTIDGFTVDNFGKLYRSCGNCKESAERHVVVKDVKATSGKLLVGINTNFGDSATITKTCTSGVKAVCAEYKGTTPGNEPTEIGEGPSAACKYQTSDITAC